MDKKRQEFNKLTNETIKNHDEKKKKNSDASLFRQEKRIQEDTERLLKNEVIKDETSYVDAYSNTPSSKRISKSRSLSLTNSTYSTKLLEKIVQGQTDNEFTRATLAYHSSSLKLLEEIKESINGLKETKSNIEETNKTESLEREVSSLANSIAQLDIPSLYKELKRSSIRMFDKTGITDTLSMVFEMMTSTMGDKSDMMNMVKGKIKNGVLNKAFGKNMAQYINKFEMDPMETIQDFINMQANSNNQFFRTFFGKHAKGVEIKKSSDRRTDGEDFKALNDKLTYNTINYRLPESLDRIEAAITGNVKRSYDYSTNKYLTDQERLKNFMGSGNFVDMRKLSNDLLDEFKNSLEEAFDSGKISKDELKQFLIYDDKENKLKTDSNYRFILRNEEAMRDLMLQLHKSNVDMTMLTGSNFSAENFIKNNNIKFSKHISKNQQILAANMLNQILRANELGFRDDTASTLIGNKELLSKINLMDNEFSLFTPEQIRYTMDLQEGNIDLDTYKKLMDNYSGKSSGGLTRGIVSSGSKYEFKPKYTTYNGNIISNLTSDATKRTKDMEEFNNTTKNASKVVLEGSDPYSSHDEYLYKLRELTNNNLRDKDYYSSKFLVNLDSKEFSISDKMKEDIDKDFIRLDKATELYNLFLNAKLTPQLLAASTGQSYDYWKNQGYPTCPADLFHYIDIKSDGTVNIDYDKLSKLNVKFNEKYIESIEKRYKTDTKGISLDAMDPGKTSSNILNEVFKDPTMLRKMGVKSGSAAGFFLGKVLQSKGILTSSMSPFILGGLGAAVMNMESVQNRINMILGPEGDLKGKSGFTNREIAMAKFMNKTLPRIGLGGIVAKNFYKMFSGSGALGNSIGLVGGGILGLTAAAIAPSLVNFGRNALFGDDGNGNKGVLKSIGGMLRNIPWVEKYLALNIRKEDTDETLINYALVDMKSDIEARMAEIDEIKASRPLKDTETAEYSALGKMLKTIDHNKDLIFKNKGDYARNGKSDEEYIESVKNKFSETLGKIMTSEMNRNQISEENRGVLNQSVHEFKERFKNNLSDKLLRRESLANLNGDLSEQEYDKDVALRSLEREINNIADPKERELTKKFFEDVLEENEGKDFYAKMAKVVSSNIDEDGSKRESANKFREHLLKTQSEDADYALINSLTPEQLEYLMSENTDDFFDTFYKRKTDENGNFLRDENGRFIHDLDEKGNKVALENDDFLDLMDTLTDIGGLNEDYLSKEDIDFIYKMARIKARSLSNNPNKDSNIDTRTEMIAQDIINNLNKKTINEKIDTSTRETISNVKKTLGKITGDTSIMDSEEFEKEKLALAKLNKLNVLNSDFVKERIRIREEERKKELEEKLDEESGSGSGQESVKMFNLKKYSFKNGKRLDVTGCSVATINNMLISMDYGSMKIDSLIKIANNHLNKDGSVRDSFFDDMTQRLGLVLKVYKKDSTDFSKNFFKSIKPSQKRGVIILKDNPDLPYGHFILLKSINGNTLVIDDPERKGLDNYSYADVIAMSKSVYVFEKSEVTIEPKAVRTIKKAIKNKTGIDLNKSLLDNVKGLFKSNTDANSTSPDNTNIDSGGSSDTVVTLLEKIYEAISSGILDVRIVDDLMLPLKVDDGNMSRILGEGHKKIEGKDPQSISKFYDKVRQNPASKEEFKKAEEVQDAIINGALSGGGSSVAALDPNSETGSSGGGGGLLGGLMDLGKAFVGTKLVSKGWKFIKNKLGFGVKEGLEEGAEATAKSGGLKKIVTKFLGKKAKDKTIEEATEKALKETSEEGVKFLPKIAQTMKSFFAKVFDKAPNLLKRYISKISKTMVKFVDDFIKGFAKFLKSSKKLIEKRLAKATAKGAGMKVPYLNIAIAIASFIYAFYDGYKNAASILNMNESEVDMMTKVAIGFGKGTLIALPGSIISIANGWVGMAFELYMELYGFQEVVKWFMESNDETKDNKKKAEEVKSNIKDIDKETLNTKSDITVDTKNDIAKNNIKATITSDGTGSGDPTLKDENTQQEKINNTIKKTVLDVKKNKDSIKDTTEEFNKEDNTGLFTSDLFNPLADPNRTITSAYGPRVYKGELRFHNGIDFAGRRGDPVYAVKDGEVVYADSRWGFVRIKHPDGTLSGYMHMDRLNVSVGEKVKAGQQIGIVGGRGRDKNGTFQRQAYGDHLHFEYQNKVTKGEDPFKNNNRVDPFNVLNLDPNNFKLSPKDSAKENIDYLNKHKSLMSKLNDTNRAKVDESYAKGGADLETSNSNVAKIMSELNTNIKGLNMNVTNTTSSDITALTSVELLKQIVNLNKLVTGLLEITSNQSQILERLIATTGSLRVDPTDLRAVSISRINTF